METLAQAEGYTWASRPWLNTEASYHRMVYENRSHIASLEEIQSLILQLKQQFDDSTQSRLVVRALLSTSRPDSLSHLDKIVARSGWQLGYYLNYQTTDHPFMYVTISFNRNDRGIPNDKIQRLTEINKNYIEGLLTVVDDFTEYNLTKVQDFSSKGFHLTRKMNPQELESLWWDTFWWSEKACERLLESTDGSFPIWVRDKTKRLVAAVLYSHQPHILESGDIIQHGETTEASTLLAYQGNGIMPVLVTWMHIEVLRSQILNVYGELRAEDITGDKPNSINHGIKSGKIFDFPEQSSPLLINHVSIWWEIESYNNDREIPWYNSSPPGELRSFLLWSMDPRKISNQLKDTYSRLID